MTALLLAFFALVSSVTFSSTSLAADMPAKAAPPSRTAMLYDWSGLYVGGHLGGTWVNEERTIAPAFASGDFKYHGFLGGGQVGYNVQAGPIVVGVRADASWSNTDVDFSSNPLAGGALCNSAVSCQSKVNWIATATGRIGLAQGAALIYALGGAAWINATHSFTQNQAPFDVPTVKRTRAGWTAGGGLEYALASIGWGRWSANVEYGYLDFGTEQQVYAPGAVLQIGTVNETLKMHVVKAGLNFRFGGPVVARY